MAEMFEGPKVIGAKTYETSLSVEKGMFRSLGSPEGKHADFFYILRLGAATTSQPAPSQFTG